MRRLPLPGRRPASPSSPSTSEQGQLIVIFALALVAMVGMVGLIVDGGDTFLQRRDQQNVSDAAAMAAGYASVNGQDPTAAAQAVATANGYQNGLNGTTVNVTIGSGGITVDVSRPHQNYFAGAMGFASWGVSATASVRAGIPNVAYGAMPIIFNQKAYDKAANKVDGTSVSFGEPGVHDGDVPQTDDTFNWTVFCTAHGNACNLNTRTANDLINGAGSSTVVHLNDNIAPLNNGAHTALFSDLSAKVNGTYAVFIVDDAGNVLGWANFHLTGSVGGSTKAISGWFETPQNFSNFAIDPTDPAGTKTFGPYTVKLTN